MNSIERLNYRGHANQWELIQPETSKLSQKEDSALLSLNENELMILGGNNSGNRKDVVVYSNKTGSFKTLVEDKEKTSVKDHFC